MEKKEGKKKTLFISTLLSNSSFSPWLQRHRRLVARHRRVQLVQLEVGVPDRVVHLGQIGRGAVPAGAGPLQVLQRARVELLAQEDDAELERVLRAGRLCADALAEDLCGLFELPPDQDLGGIRVEGGGREDVGGGWRGKRAGESAVSGA